MRACFMGLGYIGLLTAIIAADNGIDVIGVDINPFLKEGDLFVIESTSPVDTTRKMASLIFSERPELRDKLAIAYCPERVLPGNVIYELVHIDRVIGGINENSTDCAIVFASNPHGDGLVCERIIEFKG